MSESFHFQNGNGRTLCDKLQRYSLVCKEDKIPGNLLFKSSKIFLGGFGFFFFETEECLVALFNVVLRGSLQLLEDSQVR